MNVRGTHYILRPPATLVPSDIQIFTRGARVRLARVRPRLTQWGTLGPLSAPNLAAAPGDPSMGSISGAGAVSPPTFINGPIAPIVVCEADFHEFVVDTEASSEYTDWCAANPGECDDWKVFANLILAGHSPTPPVLSSLYGQSLVDAGIIALLMIDACPHLKAKFSFSVTGLLVTFTNLSTAGPSGIASWLWDFGDGNTSVSWDTGWSYAAPGTYLVTLTIIGNSPDGTDAVTHPVTVFVPSAGPGFHIDAVVV